MLVSQTETVTIHQAIMMQQKLHPELWIKTYHLEGKFIFKMNPELEDKKTHFRMVSSYETTIYSIDFQQHAL